MAAARTQGLLIGIEFHCEILRRRDDRSTVEIETIGILQRLKVFPSDIDVEDRAIRASGSITVPGRPSKIHLANAPSLFLRPSDNLLAEAVGDEAWDETNVRHRQGACPSGAGRLFRVPRQLQSRV